MKNNYKSWGLYILILLGIFIAVDYLFSAINKPEFTYSQVVSYFKEEKVKSFVVNEDNTIRLTLVDDTEVSYRLANLSIFYNDIGELIAEQHEAGKIESFDYVPPKQQSLFMAFLPYILIIGAMMVFMWIYMMNTVGGGAGNKTMPFGWSRAKQITENKNKKTFADVAGADEEKEELVEIVDFLKNPRKYTEIGARIPKGILLYGPPGTGKTLLAKAVAGEAGVSFFSISGSDFVEMYVGMGAARVRDLFEQAKKNLPCILFIDEIDAVGRHRGAGLGGGHDEREQTLNQLLVEMDGFGTNDGIVIIAATNRPDVLDPALLRPGRFDRQVVVFTPDIKGREEILKVHARGKPLDSDVSLATIAKSTTGMTGADLENLLNEAALLAARRGKKKITMSELNEATTKVIMGPEKKSRIITEKENKLTAYHEGGHAIVTRFLSTQSPVHEISIIPRGRAGGYTMFLPEEDKYYSTRQEMEERISSLLGGRAAEELALSDISTGASNDIERATDIARKMIVKYGMSQKLGPLVFGNPHEEVFLGRDFSSPKNYSENTAAEIDSEIRAVIERGYKAAKDILSANIDKLHTVAKMLLEKEKVSGEEFEALFGQKPAEHAEHAEQAEPAKHAESTEPAEHKEPENSQS